MPVGTVKMGANSSRSVGRRSSASHTCRPGLEGPTTPLQHTRWSPFQNDIVSALKSQRMGPRDASHYGPRTKA